MKASWYLLCLMTETDLTNFRKENRNNILSWPEYPREQLGIMPLYENMECFGGPESALLSDLCLSLIHDMITNQSKVWITPCHLDASGY